MLCLQTHLTSIYLFVAFAQSTLEQEKLYMTMSKTDQQELLQVARADVT